MDYLKQERTDELSTRGFTTIVKLKATLKKFGIKVSKKSSKKAELIRILVEHEFANAEATEKVDPELKQPETTDDLKENIADAQRGIATLEKQVDDAKKTAVQACNIEMSSDKAKKSERNTCISPCDEKKGESKDQENSAENPAAVAVMINGYILNPYGHQAEVGNGFSVALSSDGRFAVSGSGKQRKGPQKGSCTLCLWDLVTGEPVRRQISEKKAKSLAKKHKRMVKKHSWYTPPLPRAKIFAGHSDEVLSVAFSPDGKHVVSGSRDETIRVWNVESGTRVHLLNNRMGMALSIAFSPDGKHIVSGSWHGQICLWDMATGELELILGIAPKDVGYEHNNDPSKGHTSTVYSVALSADGKEVVSGSRDKTIRLWNLATRETVRIFEGHTRSVNSVALSADGKQVVSGSCDKTIRLWNLATGETVRIFEGHTEAVLSVALSADGKQVVSGSSDRTIRLWNLATGETVRTIDETGSSVVLSSDGKHVLNSCGGEIRLWNLESGKAVRVIGGERDFSDDDDY